MLSLQTLERVFTQWAHHMDITLNLDSDEPTDAQVRANTKFPFNGQRWANREDERLIKEDFITMRQLLQDLRCIKGTDYGHVAVRLHEPTPYWLPRAGSEDKDKGEG